VNRQARQPLAPGWTCGPGKAERLPGFDAKAPLAASLDIATRWHLGHHWL